MKVSELACILSKYNPDMDVVVNVGHLYLDIPGHTNFGSKGQVVLFTDRSLKVETMTKSESEQYEAWRDTL